MLPGRTPRLTSASVEPSLAWQGKGATITAQSVDQVAVALGYREGGRALPIASECVCYLDHGGGNTMYCTMIAADMVASEAAHQERRNAAARHRT